MAQHTPLLRWYKKLAPRTVDLVGDFVGSELFIIEGDSLLLECFSNEKLDFSPGFQLLHATYLVERLLEKLQQRKCIFDIVFFSQNCRLCIPSNADEGLEDRYLLAREVIIQHLTAVSKKPLSGPFKVKEFDSFQSLFFEEYLANSGAYLLLCHDGAPPARTNDSENQREDRESVASSDDESNSEIENDIDEDEDFAGDEMEIEGSLHHFSAKVKLRQMIYWLCVHGCNISLINSLEFRDTKVFSMVIEGFQVPSERGCRKSPDILNMEMEPVGVAQINSEKPQSECDLGHDGDSLVGLISNQASQFIEEVIVEPNMTQRTCLSVVTLALVLSRNVASFNEDIIGAAAFISHLVLLQNMKLEDRAIHAPEKAKSTFFTNYLKMAKAVIVSSSWKEAMERHDIPCDICDIIDGRAFFHVLSVIERAGLDRAVSPALSPAFNRISTLLDLLCEKRLGLASRDDNTQYLDFDGDLKSEELLTRSILNSRDLTGVLPFKNAVFDGHLQSVHLEVEASLETNDTNSSRVFKEETHWHKPRPLDSRKGRLSEKESFRNRRRNQFYMAEMQRYAESLLGTTGSLRSETIVAGSSKATPSQKAPATTGKVSQKLASPSQKKNNALNVKQDAAMDIRKRAMENDKKLITRWQFKLKEFELDHDLVHRYVNTEEYFSSLTSDIRSIVAPQVLAYMLETLLRVIREDRGDSKRKTNILLPAHAWGVIIRLMTIKQGVSVKVAKYVENICQVLRLPKTSLKVRSDNDQPLSFNPSSQLESAHLKLGISEVNFQLQYGGPFMERSINSLPDARTPDFEPDLWQREVLDQIDSKGSAFIVAPTSAGKTFISFYAMRQVLKEDNDGILVYVAPTKALVNQIAAEVQIKFRKDYPSKSTAKSIWAIHTRDYRINNPTSCQILITVPHILQIMLLSPSRADMWTPRLRRIIFDEIHCIGQAQDGVVWEQLLLLSPCPIIALSATIGNPGEFYSWLKHTQGVNGHELKMIQHKHRYSDLRKYLYCPDDSFKFEGLPKPKVLHHLGLDEAHDMKFLHPILSLVDRSRGIPEDFSLEPRDCLSLWQAMHGLQTDEFPVDKALDPQVRFSGIIIQKIHIIEWQRQLIQVLERWMKDRKSPFEALLQHLSLEIYDPSTGTSESKGSESSTEFLESKSFFSTQDDLTKTTLQLICSLYSQGALPALVFNYDRSMCEAICYELVCELKKAENKWKSQSPKWKAKVEQWQKWKKSKDHEKKAPIKSTKRKGRHGNSNDTISRAEQLRDSSSADPDSMADFDPEKPHDKFNLSNPKKLTDSELSDYIRELRSRGTSAWLLEALGRGIGVHHAGMNRRYRHICEILFRKGFLLVVIATGTLALGINMPCKTVVFSGDSLYLTPLNFRQASGRAGRRGFDLLGNVVFHQVPLPKIQRLISSRLPDLNGHFPITTSLILRLFILLHGSEQAESAKKSIASVLSSPRICLGGREGKDTVSHFLRFSIEYLRRNNLLDASGVPLGFAGCISHLYYTESSSFAFHALLNSGYFNELCRGINNPSHSKSTVRKLMLVMSHIFGRFPLRRATLESHYAAEKRASSIVVLPPLPRKAAKVLQGHNSQVLDIYIGYVSTYIDQNVKDRDCCLPLSGLQVGGDKSSADLGIMGWPRSSGPKITSSFFALSGHGDNWDSVASLCEMVRRGVWLEESVVPYVPVTSEKFPLNAYLYDFFKHGNIQQLETANGIRRNDVWYRLNDFSMILATLVTSLENFLNPRNCSDPDLLDVSGRGDSKEVGIDDLLAEELTEGEGHAREATMEFRPANIHPAGQQAVPKKQAGRRHSEVVNSWEDECSEEESGTPANQTSEISTPAATEKDKIASNDPSDEIKDRSQSRQSLMLVLKAFRVLQSEFDGKFKKMWA